MYAATIRGVRRRPPHPPSCGLARIGAVVEGHGAFLLEVQHGPHVLGHASPRLGHVALGVLRAQAQRLLVAHPVRHVTVQGVVGARLVRDEVGHDPAPHALGQDVGRVAQEADGERPSRGLRLARPRERVVQAVAADVEVTGLQAPLDPLRVHLSRDEHALVHGGGQRLRAAHAAQAGGEDEAARQASAEVLARRLGEGLVGALEDSWVRC